MKIKRVPPKVQTSTSELYEVQKDIAKLRSQLRVLEGIERQLITKLQPVYVGPEKSGVLDVLISGLHYTVKYRHVGRDTINVPAVERVFASLGKPVPRKHSEHTTLKVAKAPKA